MTDDTTVLERGRFRRTLVRVLLVQAVSLLVLGVLQAVYNAG